MKSYRSPAKIFFLIPCLLLSTLIRSTFADVIYVRSDNPAVGNGTSWASAYRYLQTAIAAAQSGDEIWVKQGSHYPDVGTGQTDNDRFSTFTLKSGVSIYGGFDGVSTAFGDRDPDSYVTILSGDIAGTPASNADNAYNVVTGTGTDATAILDGFTVSGGNANFISFPTNVGGGLTCYPDGAPTVRDCTFDDNHSSNLGGGIYVSALAGQPSPTFTDCTFSNNTARSGGGVLNRAPNTTFLRCEFIGNSSERDGAGVYNQDTESVFTNCTFTSNTADRQAGGVFNDDSSPTFTGCTFTTNTSAVNGGAIFNSASDAVLNDCSFIQNSADEGGGLFNIGSSPVLTDCTFTENSARLDGGAVFSRNDVSTSPSNPSNPEYDSCTFDGNTANNGGALSNNGLGNELAQPLIIDCTFTGNAAGSGGGAIRFSLTESRIESSIFSSNTSGSSGAAIFIVGGGDTVVEHSEFNQNQATGAGGAISLSTGTISISNSNFTSNTSLNIGGALSLNPGSVSNLIRIKDCDFNSNNGLSGGAISLQGETTDRPLILRCAFVGNAAAPELFSNGGALNISDSSPDVVDCLFSGNLATRFGGALYFGSFATPRLTNCTVSGNKSGDSGAVFLNSGALTMVNSIIFNNARDTDDTASKDSTLVVVDPATATISYSLLDNYSKAELDAASGNTTNFEPLDPLFATPVDSSLAPTNSGSLELTEGSPAIDGGNTTANGFAIDLAGNPRPVNSAIDLGAFEYQGPDPFFLDGDNDGIKTGVERAIGTNPSVPDRSSPRNLRLVQSGATVEFSFGYDASTAASITLELRRSIDLINFDTVIASSETGFPTPDGAGIITIVDPSPPAGKAFYQLYATQK